MKAFFAVTLALMAGTIVATMIPYSTNDDDLASAVALAEEELASPPVPPPDEDSSSDAPRLLTELDLHPQPIPVTPPTVAVAPKPVDSPIALVAAALPDDGDWPQWGGTASRNNAPRSEGIPSQWDFGVDRKTGEPDLAKARNVKWVAQLGSQSYGNPVVSDGRIFVGTNNTGGGQSDSPPTWTWGA